jgi:hypothetical protein
MIPYMNLNEQVDADFTRARRRARLTTKSNRSTFRHFIVAKAWPTCSWRTQNEGSKMPGTRVPGSLWWRGMREPGGSTNAAAGRTVVRSSTPLQVTTVQSLCVLIDM